MVPIMLVLRTSVQCTDSGSLWCHQHKMAALICLQDNYHIYIFFNSGGKSNRDGHVAFRNIKGWVWHYAVKQVSVTVTAQRKNKTKQTNKTRYKHQTGRNCSFLFLFVLQSDWLLLGPGCVQNTISNNRMAELKKKWLYMTLKN